MIRPIKSYFLGHKLLLYLLLYLFAYCVISVQINPKTRCSVISTQFLDILDILDILAKIGNLLSKIKI
jgi:hypothetical protein